MLRNGNVHSAEDWPLVLEPILQRYRGLEIRRFFRGDAAFADPKVYQCLEAERYLYAIRLPAKRPDNLQAVRARRGIITVDMNRVHA